jgi:hypothetical protein
MKIVRHDERVLELRGRDQSGHRGSGGGFMLWTAIAFFGGVFLLGLVLLWKDTDGCRRISIEAIRGATVALTGMALFVPCVSLLFKREALILDLELRRGVYRKWWFSQRSAQEKQFRFDQIDSVTFEYKIEVVSVSGDRGSRSRTYEKWVSKLRLGRGTTIGLCKLVNEIRARDIAEKVCKALGVELLDKTVERGAERIAAKDLDRPLVPVLSRKDAPRTIFLEEVKFPDPPPETKTQLHVDKAAREIRLEYYMGRWAFLAVISLIFGVVLLAIGGGGFSLCFFSWAEPADQQIPKVVAIPCAVVFIVGLILIVNAPLKFLSKERLTITSTHLLRSVRLPGHRFFALVPILGRVLSRPRGQIPLNEIESVSTKTRGDPPRIDVRSDKKILRASVGQVEAEELKWKAAVLRSGIRAMGH